MGVLGLFVLVIVIAFVERLLDVTIADLLERFIRLLLGGG